MGIAAVQVKHAAAEAAPGTPEYVFNKIDIQMPVFAFIAVGARYVI